MSFRYKERPEFYSFSRILWSLSVPAWLILLWYILPIENRSKATATVSNHPNLEGTNNYRTQSIEIQAPPIPPYALTAVLPLTVESIETLDGILLPLLSSSQSLREIILVSPQSIVSQARVVLRELVSSDSDGPDILLQTLVGGLDHHFGVVNAASQASTEWVLLMDHRGLTQENELTRHFLLHPPAVSVPVGPRGVHISSANNSCVITSDLPQPASYLYPPFVMPTFLAAKHFRIDSLTLWADLGGLISASRLDGLGGVVVGFGKTANDWCTTIHRPIDMPLKDLFPQGLTFLNDSLPDKYISNRQIFKKAPEIGTFIILLPTLEDFRLLGPLVCLLLLNKSYHTKVLIYGEFGPTSDIPEWERLSITSQHCNLPYFVRYRSRVRPTPPGHTLVLEWLQTLVRGPDIIIYLQEEDTFAVHLPSAKFLQNTILIRIPREDLPYCSWMGSLSLPEWRNWNLPRVDISIITKDRPHSLVRLLTSLSKGRFFGDTVDLRVHMEQSSDPATMKIVENIPWIQGRLFVHHRVIHGGLLPAVVESWYPDSNDTYGLLLEDDVELSPLFYAWTKMTLLRYRYGAPSNRSPSMFGISLYQQKHVELPLEGRRTFNARTVIGENNLFDPSTPYLSPIPCSWGAVYFPEHWREFHAYLTIRLSEVTLPINQIIVPGVRSNNWTKSWKKYFIELAYLRGYVMLYPNYPDFISLSTNHLEVGSHVKARSREKQELFLLPLMQLVSTVGLLDLPGNTLPHWSALPVLNLTGALISLKELGILGHSRRTELTECVNEPAWFDIQELMCIRRPLLPS